MPRYWVEKVQDALNEAGKPVKGSRVLVLGVAYKKDIDDVRESPALDVIELLRQKGADVRYHDPYVPSIRHNGFHMQGEPDCRHGAGPGGLCGGGNGSFELRLGDGPTDG